MSEENVLLPEVGELVVTTVKRVVPYGAYATLDEYNDVEGLIHISEISSSWVKNIREHVREGQKLVLKVLRVDQAKLHVDFSLRRVSERERKEKLMQWKQENRGLKLLGLAAEKMKVTPDVAYEKVGKIIEEHFENIYVGLEKTVEGGESELSKIGIPPEWSATLSEIATSKIKIPKMKITGNIELSSTKPDGVRILKNIFIKSMNVKKPEASRVDVFAIAPPKYRIEVTAESYKEAEVLLERVSQTALKAIKLEGGEGKFTHGTAKKA